MALPAGEHFSTVAIVRSTHSSASVANPTQGPQLRHYAKFWVAKSPLGNEGLPVIQEWTQTQKDHPDWHFSRLIGVACWWLQIGRPYIPRAAEAPTDLHTPPGETDYFNSLDRHYREWLISRATWLLAMSSGDKRSRRNCTPQMQHFLAEVENLNYERYYEVQAFEEDPVNTLCPLKIGGEKLAREWKNRYSATPSNVTSSSPVSQPVEHPAILL